MSRVCVKEVHDNGELEKKTMMKNVCNFMSLDIYGDFIDKYYK